MDERITFVGESAWLRAVREACDKASDLEQRVDVVELIKQATTAEPWSCKIWLAYCEWIWSLHCASTSENSGWSAEEQELGQQLFSIDVALGAWAQGAEAVRWRLDDSHEIWDRWIGHEQEQLLGQTDAAQLNKIRDLYIERLKVPHATWEQTSQMFSTFLSQYDEANYESIMVEITKASRQAKDLYASREPYEMKLRRAQDSGDANEVLVAMREYLAFEYQEHQAKRKKGVPKPPFMLQFALYQRALVDTSLRQDPFVWEEYMVVTANHKIDAAERQDSIAIVQRAVAHCPWSGALWARYFAIAEINQWDTEQLSIIRDKAGDTSILLNRGMEELVEFYAAWCGFLKRNAAKEGASPKDVMAADIGIPKAMDTIRTASEKLYGKKDAKVDPQLRIEKIYVQYLSDKGRFLEARAFWKQHTKSHGQSYEFWQSWYLWEISVGEKMEAQRVLREAVLHRGLDWPEKIMEMYLRHAQVHSRAGEIIGAKNIIFTETRNLAQRREREAEKALDMDDQAAAQNHTELDDVQLASVSKRKHDAVDGEDIDSSNKKTKTDAAPSEHEASQHQVLKRDRENTTILITNLPSKTTKTRLKQFFRDYGDINNITVKVEDDQLTASALVEFKEHEDVQSALIKDGGDFEGMPMKIIPGTGLTIFVTNYPPTADEAYLHDLFKHCGEIFNIRLPSLKYNTHRRFCYISFKTADAAAEAIKLDGRRLDDNFKLLAKYSDPPGKKSREGATVEGREVHVSSIDPSLSEADVEDVFNKYGRISRVNLLKTIAGHSKGAAFITFETKEDANAALALDKTKLKSKILNVEIATVKKYKPTATVKGNDDVNSQNGSSQAQDHDDQAGQLDVSGSQDSARKDHASRTITIMNVPDTVNVARIQTIAQKYGSIVKVVLRHDHQGAIIEFSDVTSAGKAALALEGFEIVPGRPLRTGGLKDLFGEKSEHKSDKMQSGRAKKDAAKFMQAAAPIRRPAAGARGGLGSKRGLGYPARAPMRPVETDTTMGNASTGQDTDTAPSKSNADFRAMITGDK